MGLVTLALTDGSEVSKWVRLVAGNFFLALIAVRGIGYYLKEKWGEMVTAGVAAVIVGGFVWMPNATKDLLVGVWEKVVES